jgi:hypothetical protein
MMACNQYFNVTSSCLLCVHSFGAFYAYLLAGYSLKKKHAGCGVNCYHKGFEHLLHMSYGEGNFISNILTSSTFKLMQILSRIIKAKKDKDALNKQFKELNDLFSNTPKVELEPRIIEFMIDQSEYLEYLNISLIT